MQALQLDTDLIWQTLRPNRENVLNVNTEVERRRCILENDPLMVRNKHPNLGPKLREDLSITTKSPNCVCQSSTFRPSEMY